MAIVLLDLKGGHRLKGHLLSSIEPGLKEELNILILIVPLPPAFGKKQMTNVL